MKRYLYLNASGKVVMYAEGRNKAPGLLEVEIDVDDATDQKIKADPRIGFSKGSIVFPQDQKSEIEQIKDAVKQLQAKLGITAL